MGPPTPKTSKPKGKPLPTPRPSASVIVVSAKNEILLLHRVHTSSTFPSAHVFPGGNVSPQQDGELPPVEDLKRHDDGPAYRRAAIRELFEESGILLARNQTTGEMIYVGEAERERGRHAIHRNEVSFYQWLQTQVSSVAVPDIDALVPFTRWITPRGPPKRFSTQMYLYFLPLAHQAASGNTAPLIEGGSTSGVDGEIQVPTSDGGVEITEAKYLPALEWLRLARANQIILFPPQFLLLHLISSFLDQDPRDGVPVDELQRRRSKLLDFVHSGNPPWSDKYISPKFTKILADNRTVLTLDSAGPDMQGSGKRGDMDRVILVTFNKEGPRNVDVRWKKDVLRDEPTSTL